MKKLTTMSKKTTVFLLSLFLLFHTVVPYRNVQAETIGSPTLAVQNTTAAAGSYVNVIVEVSNFNQIGGMEYTLMYDSTVLELSSAAASDLAASTSGDINTSVLGEVRHSFISLDGISGNGHVLEIEFFIKKDAKAGEIPIDLWVGETYDVNFQPVEIQKYGGKVTIEEVSDIVPEQPKTIEFYSSLNRNHVTFQDEFTYTLSANDLHGMAAGDFEITYDHLVLEVVSADFSSSLKKDTAMYEINTNNEGLVKFSYIDLSSIKNNSNLLTVRFRVIATDEQITDVQCRSVGLISSNLEQLLGNEPLATVQVDKYIAVVDYPDMYLKWDGNVEEQRISFEIWLEGNSEMAAGDFVFKYDAQAFEAVSFSKSTQLNSGAYVIANPKMSDGQVKFSYVNTTLFTEDVQIAVIELDLKTLTASQYPFALQGSGVCDIDFNDLQLEYIPFEADFPNHAGTFEVVYDNEWKYTGEAIQPQVEVYHQGVLLSEDKYSVSYRDNVNYGTGMIVVEGKDPYYGAVELPFKILKVKKIDVVNVPDKVKYIQNYEDFDASGGVLEVWYEGITQSDRVELSEAVITGFHNDTLGKQTLTVNYLGCKDTFEIKIVKKSLVSVEVIQMPDQTRYFKGIEPLKVTGGVLQANYNDESTELVPFEQATISGFSNKILGKQTLTGKYGTQSFTFDVEVYEQELMIEVPEGRIYPNDKVQLNLNFDFGKKITWTTSDKNVATVDAQGLVTFKKAGSVKIVAKLETLSANVTLVCEDVNLLLEADTDAVVGDVIQVNVENSTDREAEWTVSNENVIVLDEQTMTVTAVGPGTATLSAKVANVEKVLNFVVYPIDKDLSIESEWIGYREGGVEVTEVLAINTIADGQNINHLVEYTSSNPDIAMVDEMGNVVAASAGTATITVWLKDDPQGRKVSLKINVLPTQICELNGFIEHEAFVQEGNEVLVEYSELEIGMMVELKHVAMNRFGTEVPSAPVKWTSTNTKVASIKKVDGRNYLVINRLGQTVLKLQAQDLRKESIELILCVKDYMPSLESSNVTVNRTQSSGTEVAVVPVYESEITGVRIEGNDKFHAEMNGTESFMLKCDADVKTGKHKVHLIVSVDDEREYLFNLNVNVTAKLPSATVKAEGYINTFNPLESTLKLNINHKGNELEHIELEGTEAFKRNFAVGMDGTVTVCGLEKEANGKLSTKGTVKLYYAGYSHPVEKNVSFTAKSVKPEYKLNKTSLVFNPQYNSSFEIKILDKKTGEEVDLSGLQTHLVTTSLAQSVVIDEEHNVLIINGCVASGTLKFELSHETWAKNLSFSVKLTAYTKAPQIQVSDSIIELNARYNQIGSVELTMKPFNLMEEVDELTVEPINIGSEKLNVSVQDTRVVAEVVDPTIGSGRYQYKVSGRLNDGTELKGVTIVVKVERSEPTYKLSATNIKLNLNASGKEKIELVAALSKNPFGVTCTDVIAQLQENHTMPGQSAGDIMFTWTQQGIEVMLTQQAQKGTYTYILTPVFDGMPSDKDVKLVIQVHDKAVSASMSVKGSLNPLNRDGAVSALIKLKNLVDEVESITLTDDRFVADVVNDMVQIRLNEGVVLKNQTVKMQAVLQLKNSELQLEVPVSVKVARALPTLKLSTGTLNLMDTTVPGKLVGKIELGISKVNAQIDRIEAVNPSDAFETRLTFDGQTYALEVYLINGALLRQKSGTTLKYKIHYVGECDETKSPVISFKVADKSASVKGVLLK